MSAEIFAGPGAPPFDVFLGIVRGTEKLLLLGLHACAGTDEEDKSEGNAHDRRGKGKNGLWIGCNGGTVDDTKQDRLQSDEVRDCGYES